MFERFTDEARVVVRLAQEEGRRMRHDHIGTEHLLIALLAEEAGSAAQALRACGLDLADLRRRVPTTAVPQAGLDSEALATLGIDLEEVRRVTEASFGPGALDSTRPGSVHGGHIPFAKRSKKVLELSLREALRLGHNYIGTGHILLGLLREGEGLGARLLVDAGVDLPSLRNDVTRRITSEAA